MLLDLEFNRQFQLAPTQYEVGVLGSAMFGRL